jgi:hypothetical protein
MKLTTKKINKAVQEIEAGWELEKGNGYFYWVHPTDMSYLDLATVAVYKLNDFTLDRWLEEFKGRKPSYGTLAWYDQEVA